MNIGLTGGIGSGKSTVAALMEACGALRFDADAQSRALTAPGGQAIPLIAAAFGASMVGADGALNRSAMRQLVFEDASARQRLEAILHPLIGQQREAFLAHAGGRSIVFDIPLLAESATWRARVDRVVVVDCLEATQVERVVSRSGWAPDEVRRVMATQASRAQRRAVADAVIHNEGLSLAALDAAVRTLWAHWHRCETITPP